MIPPLSAFGLDPSSFREDLYTLYADLDAAVARVGPVCRLSGRCCRFDEHGHTLFLSAPEFAILLADAPAPVRPLDEGASCPWQDSLGRCIARDARPLGCRVYYCDPDFENQAPELSEQFITKLKQLAEKHGLPWSYAALHQHLHLAQQEGRFSSPSLPSPATEPTGAAPGSTISA